MSSIQGTENRQMSVTSSRLSEVAVKRFPVKELAGRGRKRPMWVDYTHNILLMDFERYVPASAQLSRNVLIEMALRIVNEPESAYGPADIDKQSGLSVTQHIYYEFIERFTNRFSIVIRKQYGSLIRSPARTKFVHKQFAYHLGEMKRLFEAGLDENMVENLDEIHFYSI